MTAKPAAAVKRVDARHAPTALVGALRPPERVELGSSRVPYPHTAVLAVVAALAVLVVPSLISLLVTTAWSSCIRHAC